jgi:hypothetical protein
MGQVSYFATTPEFVQVLSHGIFKLNTSAINGLRIMMGSGNITSGVFTLYGITN